MATVTNTNTTKSSTSIVCSGCSVSLARDKKRQRCSRCKSAFFCGLDCQRIAWPVHKRVCEPRKVNIPDALPDGILITPIHQSSYGVAHRWLDWLPHPSIGVGHEIFAFLDTSSLCRCAAVSQRWQQLSNDEWIWYWCCQRRWSGKQRICCPPELPQLTFHTPVAATPPSPLKQASAPPSIHSQAYNTMAGVVNWMQVDSLQRQLTLSAFFMPGKTPTFPQWALLVPIDGTDKQSSSSDAISADGNTNNITSSSINSSASASSDAAASSSSSPPVEEKKEGELVTTTYAVAHAMDMMFAIDVPEPSSSSASSSSSSCSSSSSETTLPSSSSSSSSSAAALPSSCSTPTTAARLPLHKRAQWKYRYKYAEIDAKRSDMNESDLCDFHWTFQAHWLGEDEHMLCKYNRDFTITTPFHQQALRWRFLTTGSRTKVGVTPYPPMEAIRSADWGWMLTNGFVVSSLPPGLESDRGRLAGLRGLRAAGAPGIAEADAINRNVADRWRAWDRYARDARDHV